MRAEKEYSTVIKHHYAAAATVAPANGHGGFVNTHLIGEAVKTTPTDRAVNSGELCEREVLSCKRLIYLIMHIHLILSLKRTTAVQIPLDTRYKQQHHTACLVVERVELLAR